MRACVRVCVCDGKYVCHFTTGNATLTEIMIGGDNRFGDDVMPVMCKGLQHLCKLATLNIRQVCLTKKGNSVIIYHLFLLWCLSHKL